MARTVGALGKNKLDAWEIANAKGVNPFSVLLDIINGDWEAIGLKKQTVTKYTAKGDSYEEDAIQVEHRLSAAKEASKYLYNQLKGVEHSAGDGTQLLVPVIYRPVSTPQSETGSGVGLPDGQ